MRRKIDYGKLNKLAQPKQYQSTQFYDVKSDKAEFAKEIVEIKDDAVSFINNAYKSQDERAINDYIIKREHKRIVKEKIARLRDELSKKVREQNDMSNTKMQQQTMLEELRKTLQILELKTAVSEDVTEKMGRLDLEQGSW